MGYIEILPKSETNRKNNRLLEMLGIIWRNEGASRHELAKELNSSKVSIGHNIEKLLKKELIEENQAEPSLRGRRPVPLTIKEDLFYSIGVSFYKEGHSNVVLTNARTEVIAKSSMKNIPFEKNEKCKLTLNAINELIEKNGIPFEKIAGIGIALTGIVDPETGRVTSSSQFKQEESPFNLGEYFMKELGKECILINTAHIQALIERKWGGAKNMNSFLTMQSGFGLGMFLNGKLYRGHQYHAGEIGSMQLQETGEAGVDGRVGTLGALAPFYRITDRIEEIIEKGGHTAVRKYLPEDEKKVTMEMVVSAIEDGDQLCAQMMSELFETIGRAIVNLAYIFNPEAIFLPAWTEKCSEVSLDIVRRQMGHYGVSNWELKTDILSSKCTHDDLAKGAALLPMEKLFKGNQI